MNQSSQFFNFMDISHYKRLIDEGKPWIAIISLKLASRKIESSINKQVCKYSTQYADVYNNYKDLNENELKCQLNEILADFIQLIEQLEHLQTKYESYAISENDLLSLIQKSPIPILVALTQNDWPDYQTVSSIIKLNECTEGKFKSYYSLTEEFSEISKKYQINTFPSFHIFFQGAILSSIKAENKNHVELAFWYDETVNNIINSRKLLKHNVIMSAVQHETFKAKFNEDFVLIQQIATDLERNLDNSINCGTKALTDAWLREHQFLFESFLNDGIIIPNFKFGENFEADFVIFSPSMSIDETEIKVTLIITNSCFSRLFTNTDQFSPELIKSIETAKVWKDWVRENVDVLKSELNEFYKQNESGLWRFNCEFKMSKLVVDYAFNFDLDVKFKILIGRKSFLTDDQKALLQYKFSFEHPIACLTYDNLIVGWHNKTCYVPEKEIVVL